jgi:trans-aconitate methyltransferase
MAVEFDPIKYEKTSIHQREWGEKLIAELGLVGYESVLDLGCGDGTLTTQIAALLPKGRTVGIDASERMIARAREKEQVNLTFLNMDINNLDFDEEFDVVFSNATLHWIKDHARLLVNVKRALRGHGRIRFNFAGDGNCCHFNEVVREGMKLPKFAEYFAGFEWPWYMPKLEDYEKIVGEYGFHDAKVWSENADRSFPNQEALVGWVEQPSLVPFLARIGNEAKTTFRDFVVSRMIEETRKDDGTYFEYFRRINVSARVRKGE